MCNCIETLEWWCMPRCWQLLKLKFPQILSALAFFPWNMTNLTPNFEICNTFMKIGMVGPSLNRIIGYDVGVTLFYVVGFGVGVIWAQVVCTVEYCTCLLLSHGHLSTYAKKALVVVFNQIIKFVWSGSQSGRVWGCGALWDKYN